MRDWLQILKDEVDATNCAAVGRRIGYSRPAVSHIYHGRYPAGTDRIKAKVLEVLGDDLHCPHLGAGIKPFDCKDMRTQAMPSSNPSELRHWITCQSCPMNPPARKKVSSNA